MASAAQLIDQQHEDKAENETDADVRVQLGAVRVAVLSRVRLRSVRRVLGATPVRVLCFA